MRKVGPACMLATTIAAMAVGTVWSQEGGSARSVTTQADVERWKKDLSNWGRWGKDDQIGAMNLITPAKRKQAATLVKDGVSVSLERDLDTEKSVENTSPFEHTMTSISSDRIAIAFHGFAHSHMDSLAHVNDNGVFYNGYKPDSAAVMRDNAHSRNSIINMKNGMFTRGVLIDVPRLKGIEYLEPGTHIYPQDIEAWEKKAGVKVSAGDVLLIYSGRWKRREKLGPWQIQQQAPGLDASMIPWLKARDVAMLGGEGSQDVAPAGSDFVGQPVHNFALVYLGVHILDALDLTAVSEMAAARKRWEFLLTIAPLAVRGGTGSPVNPLATF